MKYIIAIVLMAFISTTLIYYFASMQSQKSLDMLIKDGLFQVSRYKGRCEVLRFINITRDQQEPLTAQQLNLLKGCRNLFYLRTPKCGSRGLRDVFEILGPRYGFEARRANSKYLKTSVNKIRQERSDNRTGLVTTVHQHYKDYSSCGASHPVLLNVIRDPIEQVISGYSWLKYGSLLNDKRKTQQIPEPKGLKMTLDQCLHILGGHSKCTKRHYSPIYYLSGQNVRTLADAQRHLPLAKKNLERGYLVVGLTEDHLGFLEILELYFPQFFLNACEMYKQRRVTAIYNWGTLNRETINASSRVILEREMAPEIELYKFTKARMYNQLDKVREYKRLHPKDHIWPLTT